MTKFKILWQRPPKEIQYLVLCEDYLKFSYSLSMDLGFDTFRYAFGVARLLIYNPLSYRSSRQSVSLFSELVEGLTSSDGVSVFSSSGEIRLRARAMRSRRRS